MKTKQEQMADLLVDLLANYKRGLINEWQNQGSILVDVVDKHNAIINETMQLLN